jgi:antitoxin FitA
MAAMTIRKISESAHLALKRRAQTHGRSAEAEARLILETELLKAEPALSAADVFAQIRQKNIGGMEIPYARDKSPVEPATFE